jgi:hypothetical protein
LSAIERPRVFGIGLNKTGTSSLHAALEVLGYTGLHNAGPKRGALIRRAIEEQKPLLHYLDPEYEAFSDTPVTMYFWLADVQYPGSKFILTVRDLEEWLDSRRRHVEKNQQRAAEGAYHGKFLKVNLALWEREYRVHDGAVRSYFAGRPDDLLVLDVTAGNGWKPLCDFLGVPVPRTPFPWKNRYRPVRAEAEPARPRS